MAKAPRKARLRPRRDTKYVTALRAVRDALRNARVPAMFIGGVAVIAQGVARYTADIDATMECPIETLGTILDCFRAAGFSARTEDALDFARRNRVLLLRHDATAVDLDLSVASLPFEHDAIANADERDYAGVTIRAARAEDLLVYKLIAHRPRDIEDAEQLTLLHGDEIDRKRVLSLIHDLGEALDDTTRGVTADRILARRRR